MIDLKTIKSLIKMMVDHDLTEVDLEDQGEKVRIRRGGGGQPVAHHAAPPVAPAPVAVPAPSSAQPAVPEADEGLVPVPSPMVGTYYASPSPDAAPFVKVGQTIEPGQVVCIIEAMKVFNEIKSEIGGVVEKILVSNGQGVEFGQALIMVRP
ncbi:MAG: acetyl-CoA carboxylase biotin carboxyl carrier protein [Phycisphaeraceae bacterium]|nr:acetyl-CoA carboxylase biotin carboxyl carrier protein [Phycisphaeraceae bacterium]